LMIEVPNVRIDFFDYGPEKHKIFAY